MPREFTLSRERTVDDLHRAVRVISRHFETDSVFIIGSQSILLDHPDAPAIMRTSGEIDAYPGNFAEWEASHSGDPASEEINVYFGEGSLFHQAHGFYIDGVDENTAEFPPGWQGRATVNIVKDGAKEIKAIAPCLEDLIVAKLRRLDPKDKEFIQACNRMRPLNIALVKARLDDSNPAPAIFANAREFLDSL